MATNVVTAAFGASKVVRTRALYQWDYGQILRFAGLDLPEAYTVHFSNQGVGGEAKTMVGNSNGVDIPDEYLTTGQAVYAWVYLHAGEDDGETVYAVVIPVVARPRPTEDEPTPQQQGLIDQAIAALNAGVEAAQEAAESVQDMGVEAETLAAGSDADVTKSVDPETGAVTLTFGIPRGETGARGPVGADGVSPTVTVTDIPGGHRVTVTGADGTHSFDVMDGAQGPQGIQGEQGIPGPQGETGATGATGATGPQGPQGIQGIQGEQGPAGPAGATGATGATGPAGADGVSPTISVADITGGHRVTITDADGTKTFDVMDGEVSQAEFDELKSAVDALDNAVEELEAGSLSALGASEGQVPVAAGDGTWAWGEASGGGGGDVIQPDKIQAIVAAGKAREYFDIGDVIYIPWTNYKPSTPIVYQFPFVVVHIGDAYDQNDVKHEDALWLMAMYAEPEEMQFDAAEDWTVDLSEEPNALAGWYYWGLTGTDQYTALELAEGAAIPTSYDSVHKCAINNLGVLRYGYNRWRYSAYRQWLNSDAAKNANWWTEQHEGDNAPTTTYTNKPGWLYGFEKRWLDVIKPVKVQTAANTATDGGVTDVTYDRFFLPSLEQMYGSPQAAGVEGEYWEYWKEETGLEAPSNGSSSDTNDSRKIPSVVNYPKGSAVYCRLRSAYRGHGNYVWVVNTAGYLSSSGAANSYRGLPACVIY